MLYFQECRWWRGRSNCLSLERRLPLRVGKQVHIRKLLITAREWNSPSRPDDGAVIHAITTFGEVAVTLWFFLTHFPSLSNPPFLFFVCSRWTATHQTQTKLQAPSATLFAPSAGKSLITCIFWTISKKNIYNFAGNTRSTKRTMLQEYQESW